VNAASAAPASSTAAAAIAAIAATTTAASPSAGASSLYSINTHGSPVDEGKESAPNDTTITKSLNSVKECISPSSSHSDQKFDGILVSGKCDYESGCCGSNSFLVGASKQQAASFREAYGRSGSEDDNASGVGYDPPDGSRDLDLGFLVPLPSGFNSGEFRLVGSIGNWCTPPLRGSQGRRGSFLLRGA